MNVQRRILSCSISALVTMVVGPAFADCSALPDFSQTSFSTRQRHNARCRRQRRAGFQHVGDAYR
jgi:hypothetical protein